MVDGDGKGPILQSVSKSDDLLRRARAGEDRAVERLFSRYLPRLRRWAHRRVPLWARDAADTDDFVQDALVGTLKRLDYFEPQHDGALIGYLRRSLINRVRDQFRAAARRPTAVPLDDEHPDTGDSPLRVASGHEDRMRYQCALNRLMSTDRRAIVARLDLGYSYEQLALLLNKPSPEAARQAVRRALSRLAEEMQRD